MAEFDPTKPVAVLTCTDCHQDKFNVVIDDTAPKMTVLGFHCINCGCVVKNEAHDARQHPLFQPQYARPKLFQ